MIFFLSNYIILLGKQFSRDFNKTFSKRNGSNVLGKAGDIALRAALIAGDIVGGTDAITSGIGYVTGNSEIALAEKGLMVGGAALKGTGAIAQGTQKAINY
jgi:hypothetical protein